MSQWLIGWHDVCRLRLSGCHTGNTVLSSWLRLPHGRGGTCDGITATWFSLRFLARKKRNCPSTNGPGRNGLKTSCPNLKVGRSGSGTKGRGTGGSGKTGPKQKGVNVKFEKFFFAWRYLLLFILLEATSHGVNKLSSPRVKITGLIGVALLKKV